MVFNLNSRFILILAMLYVTISIAATVTAYKFVTIGAASFSAATIIFPINSFLCIIITEVYGYNIAKKIIWLGLFCELFFSLLIILTINLPSPDFWHLQNDYNNVLWSCLRFVISGIAADIVGMFGGAYLMSKWKILMRGKHFCLRGIASAIISDFFMTIVIGISAFTGKISLHSLVLILLSGYGLHIIYAIILIWPTFIVALFLKKAECIDVFDKNIKYNPFTLKFSYRTNIHDLRTTSIR